MSQVRSRFHDSPDTSRPRMTWRRRSASRHRFPQNRRRSVFQRGGTKDHTAAGASRIERTDSDHCRERMYRQEAGQIGPSATTGRMNPADEQVSSSEKRTGIAAVRIPLAAHVFLPFARKPRIRRAVWRGSCSLQGSSFRIEAARSELLARALPSPCDS